ncbi:MAG: RagB/SusD family nutrient uptake outer membrane protein [Bacteroidales bacterium]
MKKILMILATLFTLSSCDGFLDVEAETGIPEEEAIETIDDVRAFRVGIYSAFKNSGGIAYTSVLASEMQADLMLPVQGNTQSFAQEVNWTINSQNFSGSSVWESMYQGIARTNFLLSKTPALKAKLEELGTSSAKSQIEEIEQIEAECYFARAFARVELVKLFADAYDPAKASTQLALPIWNKHGIGTPKRETMEVYYNEVLADIEKASILTQGISTGKYADEVYFTLGTVLSLKTRVHVYMQEWEKAIETATKVIEDFDYELADAKDATIYTNSSYYKMWKNDTSKEIIWKVAYINTEENLASLGGKLTEMATGLQQLPDFIPSNDYLNLYVANDIRRKIFFIDNVATDYSSGLVATLLSKYPGNPELNNSSVERYVNMPKVFRLSEIYLLRAEAYSEINNSALSCADLTTLLSKRIDGTGYEVVASGEELKRIIREERVRELGMEGHRLYDLKRYKQGFSRKSQTGTQPIASSLSISADNVRFTWPIPKHELDVPNSQMVGNESNNL